MRFLRRPWPQPLPARHPTTIFCRNICVPQQKHLFAHTPSLRRLFNPERPSRLEALRPKRQGRPACLFSVSFFFKNKLKCKIIIADCGKKYNRDMGFCSNPLAPICAFCPCGARESAYGDGLFCAEAPGRGEAPAPANTPKRRGWRHRPPFCRAPCIRAGAKSAPPAAIPHETGQGTPPANADGVPVPSRLIREPGGSSGLCRQSPYGV